MRLVARSYRCWLTQPAFNKFDRECRDDTWLSGIRSVQRIINMWFMLLRGLSADLPACGWGSSNRQPGGQGQVIKRWPSDPPSPRGAAAAGATRATATVSEIEMNARMTCRPDRPYYRNLPAGYHILSTEKLRFLVSFSCLIPRNLAERLNSQCSSYSMALCKEQNLQELWRLVYSKKFNTAGLIMGAVNFLQKAENITRLRG